MDLDLLAEKREMNSLSSWAFSSFFLFWFFIRFCISWEASYQKS